MGAERPAVAVFWGSRRFRRDGAPPFLSRRPLYHRPDLCSRWQLDRNLILRESLATGLFTSASERSPAPSLAKAGGAIPMCRASAAGFFLSHRSNQFWV